MQTAHYSYPHYPAAAPTDWLHHPTSESSSHGVAGPFPSVEQQRFPYKLYDMLELASSSPEHAHVVSWSDGGRSFVIRDQDAFMEHVAPIFFNQSRSLSALLAPSTRSNIQTRQLNLWGFRRIASRGQTWVHERFGRGRADELQYIARVEIKGATSAAAAARRRKARSKKKGAAASAKSQDGSGKESARAAAVRVWSPTESIGEEAAAVSTGGHAEGSTCAAPPNRIVSKTRVETIWPPRQDPVDLPRAVSVCASPGLSIESMDVLPYRGGQSAQFPEETDRDVLSLLSGLLEPAQPPGDRPENDEDALGLFSDIFEPEEGSRDDDLSSILSLDEMPGGSFYSS